MQSRPIRTHRFWTVLSKYAKMKRCLQIKQINRYFLPLQRNAYGKFIWNAAASLKRRYFNAKKMSNETQVNKIKPNV